MKIKTKPQWDEANEKVGTLCSRVFTAAENLDTDVGVTDLTEQIDQLTKLAGLIERDKEKLKEAKRLCKALVATQYSLLP